VLLAVGVDGEDVERARRWSDESPDVLEDGSPDPDERQRSGRVERSLRVHGAMWFANST
jgi:hypothetical protein